MKGNNALTFESVLGLIVQERHRQKALDLGGDTDSFDKTLFANDFIALAVSYLGRATQKSFRNERENQPFEENVIKAITVLCACLENQDTAIVLQDE